MWKWLKCEPGISPPRLDRVLYRCGVDIVPESARRVDDLDHTTAKIFENSARPGGVHDLHGLVVSRGRRRELRTGEAVFCEGDMGDSVYACVRGRLKLVVTTPGGRELVLALVDPGAVFGELSAIDGGPRSASAVALDRCTVALLTRAELLESMTAAPELALGLLRSISTNLRATNSRVSEGADVSVSVRAARRLVDLTRVAARHTSAMSGDRPSSDPTPPEVVLPITQQDLAGLIGATREATARALALLRDEGVVRTARGRIVVIDLPRLAAHAAG